MIHSLEPHIKTFLGNEQQYFPSVFRFSFLNALFFLHFSILKHNKRQRSVISCSSKTLAYRTKKEHKYDGYDNLDSF